MNESDFTELRELEDYAARKQAEAERVTKELIRDALIRSLGLSPDRFDIEKFWALLGGRP